MLKDFLNKKRSRAYYAHLLYNNKKNITLKHESIKWRLSLSERLNSFIVHFYSVHFVAMILPKLSFKVEAILNVSFWWDIPFHISKAEIKLFPRVTFCLWVSLKYYFMKCRERNISQSIIAFIQCLRLRQ